MKLFKFNEITDFYETLEVRTAYLYCIIHLLYPCYEMTRTVKTCIHLMWHSWRYVVLQTFIILSNILTTLDYHKHIM